MLIRKIKKLIPRRGIETCWHLPNAILANMVYGFPARKLNVIAVAGTKGKSTTCQLLTRILEHAGNKVALLSTITIKIGNDEKLNYVKMTTPSAWFIQQFLRNALKAQCTYVVLEVTSHALAQYRTWGIPFQYAIITNLMPDHLDYHKTAEDYQHTHVKLLVPSLKKLIVNLRDEGSQKITHTWGLADVGEDPTECDGTSRSNLPAGKYACLNPTSAKPQVPSLVVHGKNPSIPTVLPLTTKNQLSENLRQWNIPLLGEFNFQNALAAATLSKALGIPLTNIQKALEDPGTIPGRMETIAAGQPFSVIVDYAHSPDSLTALFNVLKPLDHKNIITVFGACGDRDASVRPTMGNILDTHADYIVVTNDDPYTENPEKIANDLLRGITYHPINLSTFVTLDRRAAIAKAISLAKPSDLVLVLGKGAEQWQVFHNKKIPWDDRTVVREILKTLP